MLQTPEVLSLNMEWSVWCREKSFRIFRILNVLPVTFNYL